MEAFTEHHGIIELDDNTGTENPELKLKKISYCKLKVIQIFICGTACQKMLRQK
jgi:hypothetical protein